MIGAWDRKYSSPRRWRYGKMLSYHVACDHLRGLRVVEDWGCGYATAKPMLKDSIYIGIDGSGPWADVTQDLRERNSTPDGILMRHVLEHNEDWRDVLGNALRSFTKRMSLVLFTPLAEGQVQLPLQVKWNPDIVTLSLPRDEFQSMIEPFLGVTVRLGDEAVFLLSK